VPRSGTADRSYGEPAADRDLEALGVRMVAILRKAKVSPARRAAEHARGFRRLVKWRTGSEGRISYLKRAPGWTAAEEPRSGARTVTSPTTWSGSAPWPADPAGHPAHALPHLPTRLSPTTFSGRSSSHATDPDIGVGAYGPSTEIRTRTNIPL
jgi:hypothetical protein